MSTDVLGRLVEVLSGQSLGEFFAERIFRPLGMQDTAFHVPTDKLDRAAQPWAQPGGPPMTPRFEVAMAPTFQSGGGGLVSTALDYVRFAQMLLHGGEGPGARLLGRKTVEFMTADHLGSIPYDAPGMGFGLGFQVRREAGIARLPGSVGEYGWAGNAGTLFWNDPPEQLIAIYMIQVSSEDRIALRNQLKPWSPRPLSIAAAAHDTRSVDRRRPPDGDEVERKTGDPYARSTHYKWPGDRREWESRLPCRRAGRR